MSSIKTKKLRVSLSPQAMFLLKQIHGTGLFGLKLEDVAERFICDKILEQLDRPFLNLQKLNGSPRGQGTRPKR